VKGSLSDLAIFGGAPAFAKPLHVAQVNLPPWHEIEASFRAIFERRYFANHGPLVGELEARISSLLGVQHAICVTNGTVALTILAAALEIRGEVIVPAFTFPATAQALSWAGLAPVLCDVDPETHMASEATITPCITPRTKAILAVHLWGRPCTPEKLEALAAKHGLSLIFDACHAFDGASRGRKIGTFGAGEAFSFHATKVVSGGEGGCITTNDKGLAERLRTIRSFHPSETFCQVEKRMNGKMSEAQAAMTLLGLDHLPANVAANRRRHEAFRHGLAGIPGVTSVAYAPAESNSYQYMVLEIEPEKIGIDRDTIMDLLAAENVICRRHFSPGLHRIPPFSTASASRMAFPGTDYLCRRLLQLPNSQSMTEEDVETVCALIRTICNEASGISDALGRLRR